MIRPTTTNQALNPLCHPLRLSRIAQDNRVIKPMILRLHSGCCCSLRRPAVGGYRKGRAALSRISRAAAQSGIGVTGAAATFAAPARKRVLLKLLLSDGDAGVEGPLEQVTSIVTRAVRKMRQRLANRGPHALSSALRLSCLLRITELIKSLIPRLRSGCCCSLRRSAVGGYRKGRARSGAFRALCALRHRRNLLNL